MILVVDHAGGHDDGEQEAQKQSAARHHSIIDWLSRESSELVRQSNI